jgi:hypothetical protein
MVRTGKMQVIGVQWMRFFLALMLTGVFCYLLVTGREVPDFLIGIMGMVVGVYFRDASSAMIQIPGEGSPEEDEDDDADPGAVQEGEGIQADAPEQERARSDRHGAGEDRD